MDRYWLLTWSTYGTRLPGDSRGFVSPIRNGQNSHIVHNIPQTPYDANAYALELFSKGVMKGTPVKLDSVQAPSLLEQLLSTSQYRAWELLAVAIMANHVHLVVGVPGDPEPETILRDFKAYGSRKLNKIWGKPASGTWWTESGSRRKLPAPDSVLAGIRYVLEQEFPLLVWTASIPELGLKGGILK
jgi:REP element-mobilizing transposase RayT